MKTLLIAGLVAFSTSAIAAPFDYVKQIGHAEYDYTEATRGTTFEPVVQRSFVPSVTQWALDANVDGIAFNDYQGEIVKSGPSRISLYEFVRDSPEGIAYRDYHEQYPVDTDWAQVAREYREDQQRGIAATIATEGNAS